MLVMGCFGSSIVGTRIRDKNRVEQSPAGLLVDVYFTV